MKSNQNKRMLKMVMVIWIITPKCMTEMMKLVVITVGRKRNLINRRGLMDREEDDLIHIL